MTASDNASDAATSPGGPLAAFTREIAVAEAAARAAGNAIMVAYRQADPTTAVKGDGSPVTEADFAADHLIRQEIGRAFPDDALLTEEGADDTSRLRKNRCWVIDPLDGTAQFIARTGEFDVFIALVVDGRPAVAVTCHPPSGRILAAVAGGGAWWLEPDGHRRPARITPRGRGVPPRLVASKWYGGLDQRPVLTAIATALGAADPPVLETGFTPRKVLAEPRSYDAFLGIAPHWRQTPAREWDIAAPDLIVHEAGGRLTDLWGRQHRYNKRSTRVNGGLLVCADPILHDHLLSAIRDVGMSG